jgi:hypothetical protein
MRYSNIVFITFLLSVLLLGGMFWHSQNRLKKFQPHILIRQSITRKIGLPDLAITTAARYLRHYSLTDINTPFQDYPGSLDHFPAGFAYCPPDFENFPVKFRIQSRLRD